jgi:hypothetical protein
MTAGDHMKLIVPFILMLAFSGTLFAAESMSAGAIKSLLTDNTIKCKNLQKNIASDIYFRSDGTATRFTSEGKKLHGNWRVTDDGQHCVDWGERERFNLLVDQGSGSYQKIEDDKPRAEFTVTEGNPMSL